MYVTDFHRTQSRISDGLILTAVAILALTAVLGASMGNPTPSEQFWIWMEMATGTEILSIGFFVASAAAQSKPASIFAAAAGFLVLAMALICFLAGLLTILPT